VALLAGGGRSQPAQLIALSAESNFGPQHDLMCGLVKQLYRPVCSYWLLAGFSAVAQTCQLSHTACSLSFAYFNARIFTTIKTRVRRGHLKWHFLVASARCQAVVLPIAICRQLFLRYRAITTSI
jgi:hypothetical protein